MTNAKLLIYQLLPRLYTNTKGMNIPWGTIGQNGCGKMEDIDAARLERIARFGFTHVWYTGLIEHATCADYSSYGILPDNPAVVKGMAGSPYAIKDYYDIDPDLSRNVAKRIDEFEALVERTHKAGLGFIMDFVPNHVARRYGSDSKPKGIRDLGEDDDCTQAFSPQNNFYYLPGQPLHVPSENRTLAACRTTQNKEAYVEMPAKATGNDHFDAYPSANDWYETAKLNYGIDYCGGCSRHFTPTPDTWVKMSDILLYWAGKGVDAFRCDMAEMVPPDFWKYAISKVHESHPSVIFIAEIYNPAAYRTYLNAGFTYLYDKVGLYDTLRDVVCRQQSACAITSCWQQVDDFKDSMLNFLENHDEQRIASRFFAGDGSLARPAAAVSALMGRNPFMVYAGQELGEAAADAEGFSGADGRTTIFDYWRVPSLAKLSALKVGTDLHHANLTDEEERLYSWYHALMQLCRRSRAVGEGAFFDLQYANYCHDAGYDCNLQYSFLRHSPKETLLVVANFDEKDVHCGIRIPAHAFACLNLLPGAYAAHCALTNFRQTITLQQDSPIYVDVPAHAAIALSLSRKSGNKIAKI